MDKDEILTYATESERSYLDKARLAALIEAAFGRTLKRSYLATSFSRAYIFRPYRGAVIILRDQSGISYLDKFAVAPEFRGNGVAKKLWQHAAAANPRLYWRARATNPVCEWYKTLVTKPGFVSDGWRREGSWIVFWRGLGAYEVETCVQRALERPGSFEGDVP